MSARALDLVVAGGRVVTSTEVLDDAAVGIRGGRIVAVAPVEELPPATTRSSARALTTAPSRAR